MITHHKNLLLAAGITTYLLCFSTRQAIAQSLPPVETKQPNSNYKAAFAGQTRIGGIQTKVKLNVTVINSQLKQPFALRCFRDGRFLITEKGGAMKILKADGSLDKDIADLPAVAAGGQGGLLDVNFDSNFEKNRTLFWCYSEQATGGYILAVAKGTLSADDSKLQNVQVIYRAPGRLMMVICNLVRELSLINSKTFL